MELLGLFSVFSLNLNVLFAAPQVDYGCTWHDPKLNSTFDLCELRLTNESQNIYYGVHDRRATPNVTSFEYFFNVAADIAGTINEESCYNMTLRENQGWVRGYCDNVFNYTCIGDITDITKTSYTYYTYIYTFFIYNYN